MNTALHCHLQSLHHFFSDDVVDVHAKLHEVVIELIGRQDQPLEDVLFEQLECQVLLQFGKIRDLARQNRIRRLDRLDEQGKRQRDAVRGRFAVIKNFVLHRRFRGNLRNQPACVVLVLCGQHRCRVGPGQAHFLGQNRSQHRAKLLFTADHSHQSGMFVLLHHAANEATGIQPHQPRVLGELEKIEAFVEEVIAAGKPRRFQFHPIPLIGKQHQNGRFVALLQQFPPHFSLCLFSFARLRRPVQQIRQSPAPRMQCRHTGCPSLTVGTRQVFRRRPKKICQTQAPHEQDRAPDTTHLPTATRSLHLQAQASRRT